MFSPFIVVRGLLTQRFAIVVLIALCWPIWWYYNFEMHVSICKEDTQKNIKKYIPSQEIILYCYSYHKICLKENLLDHYLVWEIIFCETFIKLFIMMTILWIIKFSVVVHLCVEISFCWWNWLCLFFLIWSIKLIDAYIIKIFFESST